jgi:signal transduction histidine kinase
MSPGREDQWLRMARPEDMARVVEALYRVHVLIAAIPDLDTVLARISEESRRVAGAEAASCMLYDPATQELYFHTALGESGAPEHLKGKVRLKLGQGIAGTTAAGRRSIRVADAQHDPRFFRAADEATAFTTRNLLAVPMLDREELVGVLEVVNKVDGPEFTLLDEKVLEMFSAAAATAVVNARLIEERLRNERLTAIGQAVTGLSHYTKNIITGLGSSADLIDLGLARGDVAILQRTWPVFKRSVKRITNFVQDMLTYSKPRTPMREACDLGAILREAHETFQELFAEREVAVDLRMEELRQPIYAEAQGLYRVFLNLLTNAADVVPARTGQIIIRAGQDAEGNTTIDVADNGPGVPTELAHKIFDPFFSTKGAKGTGLGLAVARKVIAEHGGTLELMPGNGTGACFRIWLPHTPPPPKEMSIHEILA